jgi:hypothetical protein
MLRVGWRTLFSSCAVVSVFGSGGKYVMVVDTTMYLEYHTVVVLCYFFWFWWEIVFGVTYGLCCCVSFWFWREIGSFFVVAGKFCYDRKKKFLVVCLAGCAVVSVFGSGN